MAAAASVPPTHSYFPTSFTTPFFGVPPVSTSMANSMAMAGMGGGPMAGGGGGGGGGAPGTHGFVNASNNSALGSSR